LALAVSCASLFFSTPVKTR